MVSECANPQCATPFRYFTKGSLLTLKRYRIANEAGNKVEWFWFCERCAPSYEAWFVSNDDAREPFESPFQATGDQSAASDACGVKNEQGGAERRFYVSDAG